MSEKNGSALELRKQDRIIIIAAAAHEASRAFGAALQDNTKPAWQRLLPATREGRIRSVERILKTFRKSTEEERRERHFKWVGAMQRAGWTYAAVSNEDERQSNMLCGYDSLPPASRMKDDVFEETVLQMALTMGWPVDTDDIIAMFAPQHIGHHLLQMEQPNGEAFVFLCSCQAVLTVPMTTIWKSNCRQDAFELAIASLPLPERQYLLLVMKTIYEHQLNHEGVTMVQVNDALAEYCRRVAPTLPYQPVDGTEESTVQVFGTVNEIDRELGEAGVPEEPQLRKMKVAMDAFVADQALRAPVPSAVSQLVEEKAAG